MSETVRKMLSDWQQGRAELRAIEEAEHPDITDHHGRVWVWRSGNIYAHDDTIAIPEELIATAGLPQHGLADKNSNYRRLCAICRGEP